MTYWLIFECSHLFGIFYHIILTVLIAFWFDLEAKNLQTSVLGLTSNDSKNQLSGFIALLFFTVTYWLDGIGLLPVKTSGVETITASITDLYCCWLSHFQAVLCNILIFSRYLCSYISWNTKNNSNSQLSQIVRLKRKFVFKNSSEKVLV